MIKQKFNYSGFIDRLKTEHEQLCDKIDLLEKFFQNEKFKNLSDYHKSLMVMQHVHMCAYCNALAQRILDLQGEIDG